MLGKASSDGPGLLWSKVQWDILLLFVEKAELMSLGGIDDGHNTSDRLANIVNLGKLRAGTTGDLLDFESGKLSLQLLELLGQVGLGLAPELGGLDTRHFVGFEGRS